MSAREFRQLSKKSGSPVCCWFTSGEDMIQKELDYDIKSGCNLIANFVSTYFAKEYRYTNLLSQEEKLNNSR